MFTFADVVVMGAMFAAVGLAWTPIIARLRGGEAAVAYEPRRPVPWDPLMAGVAGMIYFGVRGASAAIPGVEEHAVRIFQAVAISNLIATAIIAGLLIVCCRANADDLGLSLGRIGPDGRLGLVAFCAIAVPSMLIQALLTKLIQPSQHPILLALKESGDGAMIFWAVIAAVVVAPPVEEFVFRGVLQGCLESMLGEAAATSFAPIVVGALIFAAIHLGHGVDVVPLFFLALGLGYLYRQTHRLWPGIVVHTLLNAVSMTTAILGAAN